VPERVMVRSPGSVAELLQDVNKKKVKNKR
jgi:hypothetical protein